MMHLEFLADYFSEPLVGGFLFGATFHILIQQLDATIGVKKPKTTGIGHLFQVCFLQAFLVLRIFSENIYTLI